MKIVRECWVDQTARVSQMCGLFDLAATDVSRESWNVDIKLPDKWNVGVIVGPSGSGKTTVLNEVFPVTKPFKWHKTRSIVDSFPESMGIKEIVTLLSSVGFSSPPNWLRPFHVLSNGEQFRVTMARALAESRECAVDEFTSVVDRTVAKIGSCAIAKTVRRRDQRFVAATCHYDVIDWLTPDWVYEPHTNKLTLPRGSLCRPAITLTIQRVHSGAWQLFQRHHYLSADLHKASICFVAFMEGIAVAFIAWLPFVGKLGTIVKARRIHRVVTLSDYQGVGIGRAIMDTTASAYRALGYRALISTSNPAAMSSLRGWTMTSAPKGRGLDGRRHDKATLSRRFIRTRSITRWTASYEYGGACMDRQDAHNLIYG